MAVAFLHPILRNGDVSNTHYHAATASCQLAEQAQVDSDGNVFLAP